jgi:hypothetical protein
VDTQTIGNILPHIDEVQKIYEEMSTLKGKIFRVIVRVEGEFGSSSLEAKTVRSLLLGDKVTED